MIWALHGAFGDAEDWRDLGDSLGPGRLVAVDLWADEYELPLRAAAKAFNRRVAAADENPILLGYSMGARLGLHALIDAPLQWTGAILVAPHTGLADRKARLARREHDHEWAGRFDERPWSEFRREWTSQPVLAALHGMIERPLPPDRRARRRGLGLWSLSEQDDLRPELDQIECPVVWVTGELDETFTAIASSAVPLIRMARQAVIPRAGHRVPWDTPEQFGGLVKDCVAGWKVG